MCSTDEGQEMQQKDVLNLDCYLEDMAFYDPIEKFGILDMVLFVF